MDVKMPDGTIVSNVPDNITQSELLRRYSLFSNPQEKPEDVGIIGGGISALKRGFESFGDIAGGYRLAGKSLAGNLPGVTDEMIEMQKQQPDKNPALTFADLQRIYKENGLGSALSQVPKYAVEQTLQSAPQMAVPLAVGEAAAALSGPFAPVVGPLAGIGAYGLQQFGSLMQRQGQEKNTAEDINVGKAATAAAIQAPIGYFADKFTAGIGGLGEKGVIQAGKELAARKAAGEIGTAGVVKGVAKRAGVGAIEGFIAEAPTEALEQVLERWQAGLPLDDDKAKQEYLEAFMGAGVSGALIGAGAKGYDTRKEMKKAEEETANQQQFNALIQQAQQSQQAPPAPPAGPSAGLTPPSGPNAGPPAGPIVEPPAGPTVSPEEEANQPAQDTQAMMAQLSGEPETIPPAPPAAPPALSAPPAPPLLNAPPETKPEPKLPPKIEKIASFPMGENTDYHVLKTPTGYTANLFDNDSGKYVSGSTRMFPAKTFGDEAKTKAIDYAKEQSDKAAKFNPATPQVPVEEQPYKLTRGTVTPETIKSLSDEQLNTELSNIHLTDAEFKLLTDEQSQRQNNVLPPVATVATEPSQVKQVTPELMDRLEEEGIPIQNMQDAAKLFSNGNPVYAFHEQDEEPTLVTSQDVLDKYTPDQLIALPKEPEASHVTPTPEEEAAIQPAPHNEPLPTTAPSVSVDQAQYDKAKEDLDAALGDLGMFLTKGSRLNIMPEDEQKIMPILTRVMDAAFQMGYYKFKEAAKFVLDMIKHKLGKEAADQVSLDHLQGAYISMAGKYQDKGASNKKEVISVESLNELHDQVPISINTPEGQFAIAQDIAKFFVDGGRFNNINEARAKIAELTGQRVEPGTAEAKQADEAVEVAVVLAARQIIEQGGNSKAIYDELVNLYNRQPNLSVRSSTSIANQAYSTPAPLAFVASQMAGINKNSTVYEPTAGNGMLLIGANEKNVTANELNPGRHAMLERILPNATVTNENVLTSKLTGSFDVVIENPPFGKAGDISDIDHVIAMQSLATMKADGKAVLIVGSVMSNTEEGRREGYRGKAKRDFYFNLYNQYNVVDHFTAGGNMYAKQGTTFPVDIIVIDGKGKSSRDLPASDLPQLITSYEQLKEKLNERPVVPRGNERPAGTNIMPSTEGEGGRGTVDKGISKPSGGPSTEGKQPTTGGKPGVPTTELTGSGQREPIGGGVSTEKPKSENAFKPITEPKTIPSTSETKPGSGKGTERNEPSGLGTTSVVSGERVESGLKNRAGEEQETANQVSYTPQSQANAVGTLMPKAMAESIENSLARLEDQFGNIDDFVAESLEMDPETLKQNFSAEQIDAIALAIKNAEEGKGFIIGDQTGVGKGRVVAAMIKFALIKDKIPIFLTEKPNLYSDMIRDLDDIGMTDQLGLDTNKIKILMTNNNEKVPYTLMRNVNGKITETNLFLKSGKMDSVLKSMIEKNDLGNYKVIFTTYNQTQTHKGAETERQRFIRHFGAGNYMIFDESHNAGGAGETQARTKEQREAAKEGKSLASGRASFIRNLVQNAYGTFFSSATYAKRPDVMDLYSSTDMKLAVDKIADLANAIKNGGIPMQQTVAKMLTEVGQYIRRERTFAGVSYDTKETKVDKATAENMATSMRDILAFSRAKEIVVKEIQKSLDKSGSKASITTERTTVQSANFGSVMHSLIDQMLLSLKAQEAANYAIERLKANEKVVLTVSNTMGSFLKTYAEEMGIKSGEPVNLSFKDLYLKYLEKQRTITIKDPSKKDKDGNDIPIKYRLSDQELGPELTQQYNDVKKFIDNAGFSDAPVSPIDYIHDILKKANYKTDEITGRTLILNYAGGTPVLTSRNSDIQQRTNAVKAFNNGDLDVLILNQAGSTGLSLHAKSSFNDKRKRHMIIVQAEKNIDTHMQMLGRVHRTGQVMPPAYSQMMADIPAEMRPAAVLLKKMASLNANTTASRKSAVSAEGTVDFMNDYGGQIAQEYLRDNPEVYEAIGGSKAFKLIEDSLESEEEDIKKLTGYIPILPIKQQEEVYKDLIERYKDLIEREDSMGTNKLEAKAVDLDAQTISSKPITEDKGDPSAFAQPAYMEKVDVKRTVKPFTKDEVKKQIEENLGGTTAKDHATNLFAGLKNKASVYLLERIKNIKDPDEVKIQNTKDELNSQYNNVKTVLQEYQVGTTITVKSKLGGILYGVITNVEHKGKTKNPMAGSDWKLQIALANGDAKTIPVNFSQIGVNGPYTLSATKEGYFVNPDGKTESIPLLDMFDRGGTTRREKRWMVTGNLLAGFAAVDNMGQIMSYTKQDGSTGQGIMMPRIYDFEKEEKNAPVKLKNVRDIKAFFNQFPGGTIQTQDGIFRIFKRGDAYVFNTVKAKREGGQYYNNQGLTQIIGDFHSTGPAMNSRVWDDEKAERAIQYLVQDMGVGFVAGTNKEEARQMFAPKQPYSPGTQNIIKGRNPELTMAAQLVQAGIMTKEDYDDQVKMYKPIKTFSEPAIPASEEKMRDALDVNKREKINPEISTGTKVGLRLDIPAFNRKGVYVVSIHTKGTPSGPGKVLGYGSVAKVTNATFGLGKQEKALDIAAGKSKDVLQTVEGSYVNLTPEEAYAQAQEVFNNPEWTQIGVDPERHSYFYDRANTQPVISADEVLQIGSMLLAKNVKHGNKQDFLYNPQLSPTSHLATDTLKTIERTKLIQMFGLNFVEGLEKFQAIDKFNAEKGTAKQFFELATKSWNNGNISDDVYDTIKTMYEKFPNLLEQLQFRTVDPSDPSYKKNVAGQFENISRIVRLFKGTSGVTDPDTIRHEIVHSLEQMMGKDEAKILAKQWMNALEKARNNEKTSEGKQFFDNLAKFYADPTQDSYEAALNSLPDYSYYQYMNPSEYWAVNAEKLLASKLGTKWDQFANAVKKFFEFLKYKFGFDNQYGVHKVFDEIMNAKAARFTEHMLNDYVISMTVAFNNRTNFRGDPAPLSQWGSPESSKLDDWEYKLVDKHVDTKRIVQTIQKSIGDIADRWDAYMKETLYHGRVADQIMKFEKSEMLPLLKKMVRLGVKLDDFEKYLQNRHAPWYNKIIAGRNAQMPDGGSGIKTEDAENYMKNLSKAERNKFESLANDLDEIVKGTQDALIAGGLEKQSTIDAWRENMPFYVPLNRNPEELDFVNPGSGFGMGFGTRGSFTKAATGSTKTVVDILQNIMVQRERAIDRSEKARVGRALMGLALQAPNFDFWMPINPKAIKNKKKLAEDMMRFGLTPDEAENFAKEPTVASIDKATGQVRYSINPALRGSDNWLPVRVNGEDWFLFFNPGDPRAMRMVQALKNLDANQVSEALSSIGEATRFLAAMNTQYNPVFGAWNFARDSLGAAVNLESTPIAGKQKDLLAAVNPFQGAPAVRAIYNVLREKPASSKAQQDWMDVFERFRVAGGLTGYRQQFGKTVQKAGIVEREMKKLDRHNVRKTVDSWMNWLSDYNDTMENAVRLSAFKVAIDAGLSDDRAAEIAKNITVNFNRKGQWTANANALYAFFNANIQGSARMAQLMLKKENGKISLSAAGKKVVAGGMLLGVTQAVLLAMAGYDEDEPPEYLKNKNFIIPVTGGKYIIIPMPLGLNVFPNIGRIVAEYALSGGKNLDKRIIGVTSAIMDTFNPLGSSGFAQNISPTVLDPVVGAFVTNKDAFGRPISKEDRGTKPTPGYERTKENASAFGKGLSYAMNYLTGGGKYGLGMISPTGDQIDYLTQQYTGGVGREITKVMDLGKTAVTGEAIPSYRVPILGKLYGETKSDIAVQDKFYKNVTAMSEYESMLKRMRLDKVNPKELFDDHPEAKLWVAANSLENEVNALNKQKKLLQKRNAPKERIDMIDQQKVRLMKQFNERVSKAEAQ